MDVPKRSKITAKVSWGHPRVVFTKDQNKDEITVAHEQLLASFPLNFVSFFQFFAIFYMILSILPIKEIFQSLRQHRKKMHVLPILGQLQMQSAKVMASTRRAALSGILVCSPEVTLTYKKGQVSILDFPSTVSTGNKHDQKTKRGPRNSATFSLILIQVY